MDFTDNYDPYEHYSRIQQFIQNNLGEPVNPTTDELLERWQKMTQNMPPRMFMYIVDVRESEVMRAAGMSLLGFPDNYRFNTSQFLQLTHGNQKYLVVYQTLCMYEVFFSYPELIRDTGFEYCTTRGIKDQQGKYWHTHQAAYPCQFDEKGMMIRYISTYRILGDYIGQPLETQVYTSREHQNELKVLSKEVDEIKAGMLKALSLTKQEKWILELRANSKMPSREVAEYLEITMKTLRNHYGSINQKAKTVFPLNNFSSIDDVIGYLQQQRLI